MREQSYGSVLMDCLVRLVVDQSNVRNAILACSFPMTSGDDSELRCEVSMTGYHNSSPSFYTELPGVCGKEQHWRSGPLRCKFGVSANA